MAQIEKIASRKEAAPNAILLREKDLDAVEYQKLAKQVMEICEAHKVRYILHNYAEVAKELHANAFHAPLPVLRRLSKEQRQFSVLGASCHSVEDAIEARELGCTYITAGHIYETDCKKGLPGRGMEFLEQVCQAVPIPVYAIGGMKAEHMTEVVTRGAVGICQMSSFMRL